MSFGEFHPFLKMFGLQFITVYKFAGLKDGVASVKVQLFLAGTEGHGLVHIRHELFGGFRLAGIIAGGLDAAGERAVVVETDHIVPLPAVQGYRNGFQLLNGGVSVHPKGGVDLFCRFISIHDLISFNSVFFFSQPLYGPKKTALL